jgi:hypothetical protein
MAMALARAFGGDSAAIDGLTPRDRLSQIGAGAQRAIAHLILPRQERMRFDAVFRRAAMGRHLEPSRKRK